MKTRIRAARRRNVIVNRDSGEVRRTAGRLLAIGSEVTVCLRGLDGKSRQGREQCCRQSRQLGQRSRSRALRVRTGWVRMRVVVGTSVVGPLLRPVCALLMSRTARIGVA